MAKKITKSVANSLGIIQSHLKKLKVAGYEIDFVEDCHVIVERAALKEEMDRHVKDREHQIDTEQYVVAHLS